VKSTAMTLVGFRTGLTGLHPSQRSVPVRAVQTCMLPLPTRLSSASRRRTFS